MAAFKKHKGLTATLVLAIILAVTFGLFAWKGQDSCRFKEGTLFLENLKLKYELNECRLKVAD